MKRRSFLSWAGLGWLVSTLSAAIASCSPTSTKSKSTQAQKADGFQSLGTLTTLERDGQILEKNTVAGPVLVIRNPDASDKVSAVNPTCTHRGCTVEWKATQKRFRCPCHDAEYGIDGKVLKEPAKEPLPTYTTKIEGDQILVKVS